MTYDQAKEHLKGTIVEDGLYSLSWYVKFYKGSPDITLDGEFTAEDLEALACYMRHNRVKNSRL